ncbi:hypothetical protein Tco_1541054 [Tanacetum coccineum]
MTLDDFKTICQLPQATDNNHKRFVAAPKFFEMVPFFLNDLGFTLELRLPSNFKTTGLVQPWQTLFRIPLRRSTRLTPPTPILTAAKVEDLTLRDTIQLSIAEQKICDELEAKQNVEKTADAQLVNVIEEEDGSADDDYELRRMEKGKDIEETRNIPSPIIILEY